MWSPLTSVPRARRELARSVLQVLQRWGYQEQALPPWLDYEALRPALHRFAGEGCKFIGPDGDVRLLLPDATLGVLTLWQSGTWPRTKPVRVSYETEVYRSMGGPWRRLRQVGAELLGVSGPAGDAEVLSTAWEALQEVPGLEATVVINHVGIARAIAALAARAAGVEEAGAVADRLVQTLARGDFVTLEMILTTTVESSLSEEIWGWLTFRGSLAEVGDRLARIPAGPEKDEVAGILGHLAEVTVLAGGPAPLVDLSLLRDLGYYDGFVFQVVAAGTGGDELVAGGGRYDGLFSALDAPVAAAGFALDLDILTRAGGAHLQAGPDYVVAAQGDGQVLRQAWQEAARLRAEGCTVVLLPMTGGEPAQEPAAQEPAAQEPAAQEPAGPGAEPAPAGEGQASIKVVVSDEKGLHQVDAGSPLGRRILGSLLDYPAAPQAAAQGREVMTDAGQ